MQSGLFAKGAAYSKHNADRLFKKLVLDNVLVEDLYITNAGQAVAYVSAGPKAMNILSGSMQASFNPVTHFKSKCSVNVNTLTLSSNPGGFLRDGECVQHEATEGFGHKERVQERGDGGSVSGRADKSVQGAGQSIRRPLLQHIHHRLTQEDFW